MKEKRNRISLNVNGKIKTVYVKWFNDNRTSWCYCKKDRRQRRVKKKVFLVYDLEDFGKQGKIDT